MPTFLLISDIHATDADASAWNSPSIVTSKPDRKGGENNPIDGLLELFGNTTIDYILCAGDITNKAHPGSLSYAWRKLFDTAQALQAKLVATVGNHDIDSRYNENSFDPRGYAMSLTPKIPVDDRERFLEYWAENFTVIHDSEKDCNIVVINTAAYHGGGKEAKDEIEHGRISDSTLSLLEARLKELPQAKSNLVLCHHHPIRGDEGDKSEGGPTRGGERLLELLDATLVGWVVIHGHKHRPELFYASGSGSNSPVVLACASFSAQVNVDATNKNPNQVHLLTTRPDLAEKLDLENAGEIRSWTWALGVGWRQANPQQGLPFTTGYGYRGGPKSIVRKLAAALPAQNDRMSWDQAVELVPEMALLTPLDHQGFVAELQRKEIVILADTRTNLPTEIGRSS